MRLFFRVISAFFIFLAMSTVSFSEVLRVTYTDNPEGDARLAYEIRLLDLALSKTGREYELIPKLRPASNERVVFLMQSEGAYDVAFLGARPEIEDRLIPVRFPTYRGLLGYRIGIIRQEDKERFAQIETLHDFRSLRMCQGTGWTDTRILEQAGMTVATGQYRNLFRMLSAGRCDIFTRAVFEAYHEVDRYREEFPNLVVDEHILIRYKLASFIFVNPEKEDLARLIEEGLRVAVEDGSFRDLFESDETVAEARRRVGISERTCIEIEHSFLSAETAALPSDAWGGFDFGGSDTSNRCNLVGVIKTGGKSSP